MELATSDRLVLRHLFESREWLDMYMMHVEYRLSPAQVVDILQRLQNRGYVEVRETAARLTPEGKAWVLSNRIEIFVNAVEAEWRTDKSEHVQAIQPGEPYLPDLRVVDREFYMRLADQNET